MFVQVKLLIEPKTPFIVLPANALQPGNRVWQFQPDRSVVAADAADPETLVSAEAAGGRSAPEATSVVAPESFDPGDWVAGRVIVHEGIIPVDTLGGERRWDGRITRGESTPDEGGDSEATLWVCEAVDPSLGDESFVVVSPLGSIESGSIPARVRRAALMPQSGLRGEASE
jgi:hypothetical protein